jgi:hypothetical protein
MAKRPGKDETLPETQGEKEKPPQTGSDSKKQNQSDRP